MWTDISLSLACVKWYRVCGTSIWLYPSIRILPLSPDKVHVVQLVYTSMYVVRTSTYQYIPCLLKYFWGCCFLLHDCGKQYCMCWTCMRWCSNTKSVPWFVSNIPVIIQVHTRYIQVCTTSMYHYTFHVLVCTSMYLPVYVQVHTKYPILVPLVTIPDEAL
jgi:hypothetical protein